MNFGPGNDGLGKGLRVVLIVFFVFMLIGAIGLLL